MYRNILFFGPRVRDDKSMVLCAACVCVDMWCTSHFRTRPLPTKAAALLAINGPLRIAAECGFSARGKLCVVHSARARWIMFVVLVCARAARHVLLGGGELTFNVNWKSLHDARAPRIIYGLSRAVHSVRAGVTINAAAIIIGFYMLYVWT